MRSDEENRWSILCRDGAGRARDLIVFLTESADIALQVPPGEVAVIGSNQAGQLRDVLTQAQVKALARRQAR
jgi:hypothetical protein